jgi:hypothetical protein
MRVVLGNRNAVDNGEKMTRGKRATIVDFPDDISLGQAFTDLTAPTGVWAAHATEGAKPAWVASESKSLATLVADHFGGIEIRTLEEVV